MGLQVKKGGVHTLVNGYRGLNASCLTRASLWLSVLLYNACPYFFVSVSHLGRQYARRNCTTSESPLTSSTTSTMCDSLNNGCPHTCPNRHAQLAHCPVVCCTGELEKRCQCRVNNGHGICTLKTQKMSFAHVLMLLHYIGHANSQPHPS